jgi:hypothetical protein
MRFWHIRVLDTGKHFNPSLTFVCGTRDYPTGEPELETFTEILDQGKFVASGQTLKHITSIYYEH